MEATTIHRVIRAAVRAGALSDDAPLAVFHDLDGFRANLRALVEAFPPGTLHGLAVKANPTAALLREAQQLGCGAECASEGELVHALRLGFPPDRILFDSPAKTRAEIAQALEAGVVLNIDNLQEIERVAAQLAQTPSRSVVGVRINPQVGAGSIVMSSTAGRVSKFGVPLEEQRGAVLEAFRRHDFLRGLHLHVGSQGCPLSLMVDGVRRVVDLALEIEKLRGKPVELIDLGGGLPVDYLSDEDGPRYAEYAAALRERVPELWSGAFRLATEFGRHAFAKFGWAASRVEYTKESGGRRIAVIHAGADLFPRAAYLPELWSHRVSVHDAEGAPKAGPLEPWDVAGPLCFSGDLLARERPLPAMAPGDHVVVHDAGAYTLSMWSRYNSRRAPAVYGYEGDPPALRLLKAAESLDDLLRFWG